MYTEVILAINFNRKTMLRYHALQAIITNLSETKNTSIFKI